MKFYDAINEIKNRVNIVDIIGQYVRLKRTGSNYMGLCPFHNEKTPSFSVSENKQIFRCFGCKKGGNVYTFLMEYEGISFPEAVKFLAKKVNIQIDDEYNSNNDFIKKKEIIYKLYKDVANTYYTILFSDLGKEALKYLYERKLTKETIKKFGLGYAPNLYGHVYKLMKEKGYDDKILFESKLFGISNDKPYDFFYDRVMFPLVDIYGNVVSFQGRILGEGNSKYINTSESIIYKKSRNLYGINHARKTNKDFYILCEGNMDVISMHQAGFDNVVASWGTAFTNEQASLIKRKVNKIYLAQDTDDAGLKAIESSAELCKNAGIETYVIDMKPAKDVDEFLIKYGKEALQSKIENPISTLMFLISNLKRKYDLKNTYDYEKYINEIVKKLVEIDNILAREKVIKDVAIQENLPLVELEKQVDNYLRNNKILINNNIDIKKKEKENVEENKDDLDIIFINLLLNYKNYNNAVKYIKKEELKNENCKYIYDKIINGLEVSDIISELENNSDEKLNDIKKIIIFDEYNYSNEKLALKEVIKKIKIRNIEINDNTLESITRNNMLINDINNMEIDV